MLDIKQTIGPLWINFQSDLKELLQKRKKRTTTKMKKSLAIIALTILTLISAFAGTVGESASTKVTLSLTRQASYVYGITAEEITSKDATIKNVETLSLNRKANSTELDSATAYVSYIFQEYKGVKLTLSVSGDMTGSINDNESTIPFTVTVKETADNFDSSIAATGTKNATVSGTVTSQKDTETSVELVTYSTSNIIGDYRWASAELTVSSTKDLTGVMMDKYTATITLTATSL